MRRDPGKSRGRVAHVRTASSTVQAPRRIARGGNRSMGWVPVWYRFGTQNAACRESSEAPPETKLLRRDLLQLHVVAEVPEALDQSLGHLRPVEAFEVLAAQLAVLDAVAKDVIDRGQH